MSKEELKALDERSREYVAKAYREVLKRELPEAELEKAAKKVSHVVRDVYREPEAA